MSEILTAEEQVQEEVKQQKKQEVFKLGTVTALFNNGSPKLKFDGEDAASEKKYSYLAIYTPTVGDRILLAAISGTYIILGKINSV